MNLSVTPISFNRQNFSSQNCRKNNASAQNFGALQIKLNNTTNSRISRGTDAILENFRGRFEAFSSKIGLDTEKLSKKGICLNVFTDSHDAGALTGILTNSKNEPVCRRGHVLDCRIIDGAEQKTAEKFAIKLRDIDPELVM